MNLHKHISCLLVLLLLVPTVACTQKQDLPLAYVQDMTIQASTSILPTKDSNIIDNLTVRQSKIALPKNTRVVSHNISANKLYYALDFEPVFENPLGDKKVPKFSAKYQTELHAYDLETRENEFLYKCKGDEPASIMLAGSSGKKLAFLEFSYASPIHIFFPQNWTLKLLDLESNKIEEIAKSKYAGIEEIAPNLTVTTQGIYWLEQEKAANTKDLSFSLQYYDFAQKEVQLLRSNCYLDSSSEPLYVDDDNYALYQKAQTFAKVEGKKTNELKYSLLDLIQHPAAIQSKIKVPGHVAYPQINANYLIWSNGFRERIKLWIYNRQNKELKLLKLPNQESFKSYMLLDKYLLLVREDGLYCYDLSNNTFMRLLASQSQDNAKNAGQGDLFFGRLKKQNGTVSMPIVKRDNKSFTVLDLSVKK